MQLDTGARRKERTWELDQLGRPCEETQIGGKQKQLREKRLRGSGSETRRERVTRQAGENNIYILQ